MVSRDGSKFGVASQTREEPWGEQYFPAGLSAHASGREAVDGLVERVARQVEVSPWVTLGVAAGVGVLMGMLVGGRSCGCETKAA